MGLKVFAFFHLSKIKFPYPIVESIYVKFEYGRKHVVYKTGLANLDSLKIASFNYDISIPFSLKTDDQGRFNKHILKIKIYSQKNQGDDFKIGRCKLDIANQVNPTDINEREFSFPLNDNLNATIFYSLSIVRQKDYPAGMPASFFSPAAIIVTAADNSHAFNTNPLKKRPYSSAIQPDSFHTPNQQKIYHRSDQIISPYVNSPSSSETYSTEVIPQSPLTGNCSTFDPSNAPKKSQFAFDGNDNSISDSVHDSPEFQLRRIYLHVINEHDSTLEFIAFRQCLLEVTILSFKLISFPKNSNCDISDELIRPFKEYHVFELNLMNPKSFEDLMKPIHKALNSTIGLAHDFNGFCSILATVIHFGLKFVWVAMTETNCYLESMKLFEQYVNKLILLISQSMIAVLASSVDLAHFLVNDNENDTLLIVQNEILLQLQNLRQNSLPTCLIDEIQANCCNLFDIMLFNAFVDSNEPVTQKSTTQLIERATYIRNLYTGTSNIQKELFSHSLELATIARSLLTGDGQSNLSKPSSLTRSIADRCQPSIVLPKSLKIDKLGRKVKDTTVLRISANQEKAFVFSYDWLITNDPGCFKE